MITSGLSKVVFLTIVFFVTALASLGVVSQAYNDENVTMGPQNGTLVIVGGFATDSIISRFIDLAGGADSSIVVVPTASGADTYGSRNKILEQFRSLGANNVSLLHTSKRQIANSDSFVTPLLSAKGVWFGGGRQWRLIDAYKGTKTEAKLWEVLKRGGVIGGTSAGATVQGSYLARGDTKNNQIMTGDHEEGFGFVKNIAIDQHTLARNRHFDMFEILKKRPELLGISVDEKTAIIVKGNWFEVIGESYVTMYDGSFWSREGSSLKILPTENNLFYFLRAGDRYDLISRS